MFWSKNKKKVYPCKPQFYYIKVGCKGEFFTQACFRDDYTALQHGFAYDIAMSWLPDDYFRSGYMLMIAL